jgi:hypothetical protein
MFPASDHHGHMLGDVFSKFDQFCGLNMVEPHGTPWNPMEPIYPSLISVTSNSRDRLLLNLLSLPQCFLGALLLCRD